MTVRAVGQDNKSTQLDTVVRSTVAGTAAGYATKWLWPVTKQEDSIDRKVMINYCRKVTNKAKAKEFSRLAERTPAQDEFIKMVHIGDTVSNGRLSKSAAFKAEEVAKRVAALGGENSASGKELRSIIRNVNESSKQMIRRFAVSYHVMLKKIRQPIPFLVAGAGIGFFTGFTHNMLRTD